MMRRFLLAAFALAGAAAQAGGHFDVDDADVLDPGQCQVEAWGGTVRELRANFAHLGPACRVGPFELGLNLDRAWLAQASDPSTLGPALKWGVPGLQGPDAAWRAAVSLGLAFPLPRRGSRTGGQVLVPVTWQPLENLMIHANLGADWALEDGAYSGRGGLAGEWALNEVVSLIAERNRAFGFWTSRAGARFNLTPSLSLDLSAARSGTQGVRSYVIGLNQAFSR